jgi:hypothetical protein
VIAWNISFTLFLAAAGKWQIDLSTVFNVLLPVVSPVATCGCSASGLERDLKAPGRYRRKHSV